MLGRPRTITADDEGWGLIAKSAVHELVEGVDGRGVVVIFISDADPDDFAIATNLADLEDLGGALDFLWQALDRGPRGAS